MKGIIGSTYWQGQWTNPTKCFTGYISSRRNLAW